MVTQMPVLSDEFIVAIKDRRPLLEANAIKIVVLLLIVSALILASYQAIHGIDHPNTTVPGLTSDHPVRWPL